MADRTWNAIDGRLFDAKSLQLMAELAAEKGARVLAEIVGPGADIVIDDGVIKGQEGLPLEDGEE